MHPKAFLFLSHLPPEYPQVSFLLHCAEQSPSDTSFPANTQIFKALLSTPTILRVFFFFLSFLNKAVLSLEGFLVSALVTVKHFLSDFTFCHTQSWGF